ncbi:FecR family protein [Sphingobium naphthae]|uniref:FecR domain-containing protein n=1 Tax=Sphingobium naphthae TaxID=1886786 RepID=A0ABU3ZSV1_9SPHN|nr:FecR domain-containing protein [Sphingobium naphthae]MCC4253109.1 FecR domain-containing protein [Sphingobium naphthae]MDV5822607.1 FecR domain-containing protein [Sphingobium naphthae]MEC8036114.1 FecR domain-containing protein [Pseudomonadota bacterium]
MQASGPGSSCGDRDAIEAEAARLLARLENNPSPQDEADICAWIEADPRHAVAFARAEAAWDASERLKSAAADITLPPLQPTLSEEDQRRLSRNIMVAAGVAILLFIVAAIVTVRTYSGIEHFETGVGQMRDIALEDGSTLHLNSDSEVEARFTSNGRKVRVLKGEASFEISHDPDRPFDVEARAAVIRAVGTAFNVRLRPSLVELTVTHGTVTVHSGDSPQQQVVAGSGAVIQPRSIALTRLGPRLIEQRTAWREQMVELDGETVEQAAGEFNRYRKTPILIGDTRVSALRIGGRFRTTDSREFLTALQTSLPVRAVDGEDGSVMLLYRDETASAGDDAGE